MKKYFNINDITEKDYNIIVSNLILSQNCKFTCDSILEQLQIMFGNIDINLKSALEKALIRLKEDGFLNVLGSSYWVVNFEI